MLITPLDAANGLSVVVGVPPVEDKNRKNFMGKVTWVKQYKNFLRKKTTFSVVNFQAFQQAVANTNSRYLLDSWDSNIIQIKTEDKTKFIDGLIAIMSQ